MELPFILIGGLLIGGLAGIWLDKRLHTSPLFTFGLGLLGAAASMRELIRRLSREEKQEEKDDGDH